MSAGRVGAEAGFSLIETLLATALFVAIAFAGFDVVRHLGASASLLAQRAAAAAQLSVAASQLRSNALSAVAVWKPASACGDALEVLQRDAGGTSFALYLARANALVFARAAGPLDPCAANLQTQTLVAPIASFAVTRIAAGALAAHTDPVSGAADGGMFVASGLTTVAVDAHVADRDGTPIRTGNDVLEVTIDADPVLTTVDLVAGNRPSAYTRVLAYTCNGRCEANGPFPEIRNAAFTDCSAGYDFENSAAAYVPATYGLVATGGGNARIVVTSYTIAAAYAFAFAGPVPLVVERAWPLAVWPPAGSAQSGAIADPYPVNYAANAIVARGIVQIANDLGEPSAFGAELTACSDLHGDPTSHD